MSKNIYFFLTVETTDFYIKITLREMCKKHIIHTAEFKT